MTDEQINDLVLAFLDERGGYVASASERELCAMVKTAVGQVTTHAEVVLRQGHYFLVVNGVYLAMEGATIQDPAIDGSYWDRASLDQAAALINARRWVSAADRFRRGA